MKTFGQIRELTGRKPEGQLMVNKKIGRIQIMVYKERNGFVAYVDGDRDLTDTDQRQKPKRLLPNL